MYMNCETHIKPIGEYICSNGIDVPEKPGVYAFWWTGPKETLLAGTRDIKLKGPKIKPESPDANSKDSDENWVNVDYHDWWPDCLDYPCLYIGKTTKLKQRFRQHIMLGTRGRRHEPQPHNRKAKPANSSCQLRRGIEHVFPNVSEPLDLIHSSVGFSFRDDFSDNAVAERFFEETRLIGLWRPWFNIDSER